MFPIIAPRGPTWPRYRTRKGLAAAMRSIAWRTPGWSRAVPACP